MNDRAEHQRDESHCYCEEHNQAFATIAGFNDHVEHGHDYTCVDCERSFKTDAALLQHLDSKGHAVKAQQGTRRPLLSEKAKANLAAFEEDNLTCVACGRDFVHLQALQQHRASVIHQPLANLSCPVSSKCEQTFTSPSAMLHHLESGGCKGGMTREKLNALLQKHDTDRRITSALDSSQSGANTSAYSYLMPTSGPSSYINEPRADECSSSGDSDDGTIQADSLYFDDSDDEYFQTPFTNTDRSIFTPSSSSRASTITNEWSFLDSAGIMTPSATTCITPAAASQYAATIVYDGGRQKWLCNVPECNKAFRKKHELVAHIHSVAHAPKLFHCPTSRHSSTGDDIAGKGTMTKMFKTISGLTQHVEAGACDGGKGGLHELAELFEEKLSLVIGGNIKLLKFD